MPTEYDQNQQLLLNVAKAMGPLLEKVVFVGGITTILHVSSQLKDVRSTIDVDVIIDATMLEFQRLESQLRKLGFHNDPALVCRYCKDDLILDVMPVNPSILGFSNSWYAEGISKAETRKISGIELKILSFPYFVATKLEAFRGRGKGDYYSSKDVEDLVTVFYGRVSFARELQSLANRVGEYIREELAFHLQCSDFLSAIEGHRPRDAVVSAKRVILDLKEIVDS